MRALAFLILTTLGVQSYALDLKLEGITYSWSCGYYSAADGNFAVSFKDSSLPWGTRVYLHYGMGGYDRNNGRLLEMPYSWRNSKTVEMKAYAPYEWATQFITRVAERASFAHKYLDFAVDVVYPDGGRVRYPSDDLNQYFRASVDKPNRECVRTTPPANREQMTYEIISN